MLCVFRDVDVNVALNSIMRLNTKHYQSDFEYDKKAFIKAADSNEPESRWLLWMSRFSGTWCFSERNLYMRDTDEHFTWLYYGDRSQERILTFAVNITGKYDGIIRGDLYELDYKRHAAHVEKCALSTETVFVTMNDGTSKNILYSLYDGYKNRELRPDIHGGFASILHEPKNRWELEALLREERVGRERRAKPGDIEEYIKKLSESEYQSKQKQFAVSA